MYALHDAADAAALLFDVYEYMLVVSLHRACELSCKFFSFLQDISMFDTQWKFGERSKDRGIFFLDRKEKIWRNVYLLCRCVYSVEV